MEQLVNLEAILKEVFRFKPAGDRGLVVLEPLSALEDAREENLDVKETIHLVLGNLLPWYRTPFGVGKKGAFPAGHGVETLDEIVSGKRQLVVMVFVGRVKKGGRGGGGVWTLTASFRYNRVKKW